MVEENRMSVVTAEKENLKKLFAGTNLSDGTFRNSQANRLKKCSIQTGNGE
jgi:hypothetical protein